MKHMKRVMLTILLGLLFNTALIAGARFVRVDVEQDRRVQHAKITIELGSENNGDRVFYAKLNTGDLWSVGFLPNIERVIDIDKEYFDAIYNKALDLNYREIIKGSEGIVGVHGNTTRLTVGTRQNFIELRTWTPFSNLQERKTEEMYAIFIELFSLFDMEEWL